MFYFGMEAGICSIFTNMLLYLFSMDAIVVKIEDISSDRIQIKNEIPQTIFESTVVKEEEKIEFVHLNSNKEENKQHMKCHICGEHSQSGEQLFYHMKTDHPKEWIKCKHCPKKYRVQFSMKHHTARMHTQETRRDTKRTTTFVRNLKQLSNTTDDQRRCNICKKNVQTQSHKSHKKVCFNAYFRDKVGQFNCDVCSVEVSHICDIVKHMEVNHPEIKFNCEKCKIQFSHILSLENHQRNQHSEPGVKLSHRPAHCKTCDRWFTRKWVLKNHMLLHDSTMYAPCENCQNVFHKNHTFQRHLKNQNTCEICSLKVCKFSDFQQHKLSHTTRMNLGCKTCGKGFKFKRDLRVHEQEHMKEGIKRPFGCTACDKLFITEGGAVGCERKHTEKYRCSTCNINFLTPAEMGRHTDRHNLNRKLFVCQKCNPDPTLLSHTTNRTTKFTKETSLKRHMAKVHAEGGETFMCHVCFTQVAFISTLTSHIKQYHEDAWLICKFCKDKFRTMPTLEDHLKRRHPEEQNFNECHVCFNLFADITSHMKERHPGIFVKCDVIECSNIFRSQEKLIEHETNYHFTLIVHEQKHDCKICGKILQTRAALVRHSVVHSNQRNHECPKCPFKSNRLWILKTHLVLHNSNLPKLSCDKCPKKFKTKNHLFNHVKFHHSDIDPGVFKVKCGYCEYMSGKSYIRVHERKHTGERPNSCPDCKKTFSRLWVLRGHCERVHGYSKKRMIEAGIYSENAENRYKSTM